MTRFDVTDQDLRDEMYSVTGVWPNELVLQILSTRDGAMTSLTLLAALQPELGRAVSAATASRA